MGMRSVEDRTTPAGAAFEIAYRDVTPSPGIENHVIRGIRRLEAVAPDLELCRVTIGRRTHRSRNGDVYHVRLFCSVPGRAVEVTRTPPTDKWSEPVALAVDDAFDKARERLTARRRRSRRD